MVVLNPRHAAPGTALRLVGHRMSEAQIHRAVSVPELGAVLEIMHEHVAERPQRTVGKAMVIRVDIAVLQPHASQRIGVFARRNLDSTGIIRGLAVGGARAPGDPGTVDPSQGGVER